MRLRQFEHRERRNRRRQAPAETGECTRDASREQRARQQAPAVPEELPGARIAEHGVEQTRNPAIQRLKVENRRSTFEPVPLHDDAVAVPLVHPEVVAELVQAPQSDSRRRVDHDERQPRNADEQERPAQVPQPRRHGNQHRRRQSQHQPPRRRRMTGRGEPPDDQRRANHPRQDGEAPDPRQRGYDPGAQERCGNDERHPPCEGSKAKRTRRRATHRRGDVRPEILAVPQRNETPLLAGHRAREDDLVRACVQLSRQRRQPSVDGHSGRHARTEVDVERSGCRAAQEPMQPESGDGCRRQILRQRPAFTRRRKIEEPGGELAIAGVRPSHDRGAGGIGRAPVGAQIPRVRRARRVDRVRA